VRDGADVRVQVQGETVQGVDPRSQMVE